MGVFHVRIQLTVVSFVFILAFTEAERRGERVRMRDGRCLGEELPSCCRVCVCHSEGWICDPGTCWGCDSSTIFFKATVRGPTGNDMRKCEVGSTWSTGQCGEMCFCEDNQVAHCALTPCVVLERDRKGHTYVRNVDSIGYNVHPRFRYQRHVMQIENDDEQHMVVKKIFQTSHDI